ncbi:hypothetical protein FRC00_013764 [Tulasnella sp. 408]|nr:hypothetical protein FRC00_013764 [Tulasnella sp. 408]
MPPKRKPSSTNLKDQPARKSSRSSNPRSTTSPKLTSKTARAGKAQASPSKATSKSKSRASSTRAANSSPEIVDATTAKSPRRSNRNTANVTKIATKTSATKASVESDYNNTDTTDPDDDSAGDGADTDEKDSIGADEDNAKNLASDNDINTWEPDARSDLEFFAGDAPGDDIFIKILNQRKPTTMTTNSVQSEIVYSKTNPQMNDGFVGFDMRGYPSSIRFSTKCVLNNTLVFDGQNYHCIYSQDPQDYVVASSKTAERGRIHPKDKPNDLLFGLFIVHRSTLRHDEETMRSVVLLPHQHGWNQSLIFYDIIGRQAVKSKTIQNISGSELVFSTGSVEVDSGDEENRYETGLRFRPPKTPGATTSPSKKTGSTVKLAPAKPSEPRASTSTTKVPENVRTIKSDATAVAAPVIRLESRDMEVPAVRNDVNNWGMETQFDVSQGDLVLVGFEAKMMAFPFDKNPKYKYVTHTLRFMVHIGEYEQVDSDEENDK